MTSWFAPICLSMALLLAAGHVSSAHAQSSTATSNDDEVATALFEAARLQFKAGKYAVALSLFEQAHERSQRSRILYLMGMSAELLGRLERAIVEYRRYLKAMPAGAQAEDARVRIAVLEAKQQAIVPASVAVSASEPVPAAPAVPEASVESAPDPWYTRWWVWTAAGVVLAGATVGVVAAAGGFSGDTPQSQGDLQIDGTYESLRHPGLPLEGHR